jgi:hypothetical protein
VIVLNTSTRHCVRLKHRLLRSTLPAAAQSIVELHQRQRLLLLRGRQGQLRVVEVGVIGQDFEIAGVAGAVAHPRKPERVARGCGLLLLLLTVFACLAVSGQRVGNVAKSASDGLPIGIDELLIFGLGVAEIAGKLTAFEDGLTRRADGIVVKIFRFDDAFELACSRSANAGERELREELGFGNADVRVGLIWSDRVNLRNL